MTDTRHSEATRFLRERITRSPRAIIVLGSGLGGLADEIQDPVRIPYAEIPGFPTSAVVGHAGRLVAGILDGVEVVCMQGRFHLYEGWSPEAVAEPLRTLATLGPSTLLLTNAAGGINPRFEPGDLMLIEDHINMMFRNPLIGPVAAGEPRFPDMSAPYDPELRTIARECARSLKIPLLQGVYAAVLGPSYETPAEIRMLGRMGADAVGMSTVPEVVVARALGLRVMGISCITNHAAGVSQEPLNHEDVLEVGARATANLTRLVRAVLTAALPGNLPSEAAS